LDYSNLPSSSSSERRPSGGDEDMIAMEAMMVAMVTMLMTMGVF